MHLITGYSGTPHITAANDGEVNSHIFGNGSYIFDSRDKLSAQLVDENTVRINPGNGLFNGRFFEMTTAETVTLESGTLNNKRNDLICIRYEKAEETGIETVRLVVIKGQPTQGIPSDPTYNNGNILDEVGLADFPLYRVYKNGLSAPVLTQLFSIRRDIVNDVVDNNAITVEEVKTSNATTKAEIAESNAQTVADVTESNATTLAEIKADNATTKTEIADNNATTKAEIAENNAQTVAMIDEKITSVLMAEELWRNETDDPYVSDSGKEIILPKSIEGFKYVEIIYGKRMYTGYDEYHMLPYSTGKLLVVENNKVYADMKLVFPDFSMYTGGNNIAVYSRPIDIIGNKAYPRWKTFIYFISNLSILNTINDPNTERPILDASDTAEGEEPGLHGLIPMAIIGYKPMSTAIIADEEDF